MRIRPACLVFGVLLLVPALAYADSHNADFNGGGSFGGGGSTLGGFIVAFGTDSKLPPAPALPRLKMLGGFVASASVQFGSHAGRDVTQVVWGAGPRFTYTKPDARYWFHAQAQAVGVYTNDGRFIKDGDSEPNDFGIVVGFAFDHALTHVGNSFTHVAGLGYRLEADRVFNLGDRHDVWRVSAGLVYRIPELK